MINNLEPDEIFVFGSNLAGAHLGGAAEKAHKDFGAEMGIGEGLTGQCYAFPTLGFQLERLEEHEFARSLMNLLKTVKENQDKIFLLTKVGCGIAGYQESYVHSLFEKAIPPENLILPDDWVNKENNG